MDGSRHLNIAMDAVDASMRGADNGLALAEALDALRRTSRRWPDRLRAMATRIANDCLATPPKAESYLRAASRRLAYSLEAAYGRDRLANDILDAMAQDGINAVDLRLAVNAFDVAAHAIAAGVEVAPRG